MDKLLYYYKTGTEGIKIIYISIIASFIFWILEFIFTKLFNLSIDSFVFLSSHSFIPKIWTFLTFPIFYENILNLFFVSVMIFFTEKIFRLHFNGESFFKFFLLGNWVGAIVFLLFSYSTHGFNYLSGSILGVYSCLFSIISYNPKMKISLFPLPFQFPLYIFGLLIVGLDISSLLSLSSVSSLVITRLAAAIFGFLYMKSFQSGNDFLGRFLPSLASILKIEELFKKRKKSHLNMKRCKKKEKSAFNKPKTDEEFNRDRVEKQKIVDKILDKISQSGYQSLTKEEKDILFKFRK